MIVKAGLLVFRIMPNGRELMLVRDSRKPFYVLPGGKRDAGETTEQALRRELREELACDAKDVQELGAVEGHTPDGRAIRMHLYGAELLGTPTPGAEIAEITWMNEVAIREHQDVMTPMTLTKLLPFIHERGLWHV